MYTPFVYRSYNIRRVDIDRCYGIVHRFDIKILPTPFWLGISRWFNVPLLNSMAAATYLRALAAERGRWGELFVLSRDVNILASLLWINKVLLRGRGPRVVLWAHEVKPEGAQYRWVYRNVDGVMGTNSAIVEDLHAQFGIAREKMAVTLNPISSRQLHEQERSRESKEALRTRLGLPTDRPLVVYTGKLGPEMREIEYILEAASRLPDYAFVLTGGKPDAVRHFEAYCRERGIRNAVFTGFINAYTDVLGYQMAADVLVSYYTPQDHLVDYNYPQKITEYMLSGNPIVTPDYRATKDVLNEENAMFVAPEDPAALARGIAEAVNDPARARRLASRAREDVKEFTFRKRTGMLMEFLRMLDPDRHMAPRGASRPIAPTPQPHNA